VPEEDSELPEVETEAAEVVAVELPEAVTEVAEAVVVHPEEEPPEVELEAVPKSLSSRIDTPVSLSHVERRICSLPRILSRVSLPMARSEWASRMETGPKPSTESGTPSEVRLPLVSLEVWIISISFQVPRFCTWELVVEQLSVMSLISSDR
jgi:hypothetical protein